MRALTRSRLTSPKPTSSRFGFTVMSPPAPKSTPNTGFRAPLPPRSEGAESRALCLSLIWCHGEVTLLHTAHDEQGLAGVQNLKLDGDPMAVALVAKGSGDTDLGTLEVRLELRGPGRPSAWAPL